MLSRRLGYFETLLYFAHMRSTSQMTLTMELHGALNEAMFKQAFKGLFERHPLLRSTVSSKEGLLYYEIYDDFTRIPIDYFSDKYACDYDEIFFQQSQQQLPLEKRNWSVAIVHSINSEGKDTFRIIWHISHVVADGLSMVNLLQELIDNLDALLERGTLHVNTLPLYDKVEAYLPKEMSMQEFFANQKAIIGPIKSIELKPLPDAQTSKKAYFIRKITPRDLDYLKKKAANEGVTLNQLIQAALAKAYCKVVGKIQGVKIGSAMNLRNKCDPKIPKEICGNYFSAVSIAYNEEELQLSLGELARLYKQKLGEVIKRNIFLPTLFDEYEMQQTVKGFMLPTDGGHQESLGSSYMGEVKFQSRHLTINEFAIYPKHAGGNNLISTIFKKELRLMFCFAPEYRTFEWANSLAEALINTIIEK